MDDEKLIEFVRAHPVLYDQSNSKYMDSGYKNSIWSKIGAEMTSDGPACKTRWANIRDNFRKSLKKQKTKSGQNAKIIKPYKYSEQLKFLVKLFEDTDLEGEETNQELTGYVVTELRESDDENDENGRDAEVATNPGDAEALRQNAPKRLGSKATPHKKTKFSKENPPKTTASTVMEYVVKKNECMAIPPPPEHPVDAFLAGLAPALKTLPPREWIEAKGEMFNVVQKYELKVLTNQ